MFVRLRLLHILACKTELRNSQEAVPSILLRIAVIDSILLTIPYYQQAGT
jgi:hypothetical protein